MVKRIFKVDRRSFGRTRIRRNIDLFVGFVRVADIFYGFINGCFDSMDFCVYDTKVSNLYIAQVKEKYGIIERENYNKPKSENSKQPQCPAEKVEMIEEALRHFKMI